MSADPKLDPRTPVLVGVAQLLQREDDPRRSEEPLTLMKRAVDRAAEDAGSRDLLASADTVCVTRGRWRYGNPARVVADHLGATGARTAVAPYGGNMVQSAVNRFALDIAAGKRDVVVLAGAEYGRTQARARKQGIDLETADAAGEPDETVGGELAMVHEAELARRIIRPIQMYAIFETAIRHARGESIEAHRERVSELWARFSAVAVGNPNAWIREPASAEEIRTPSPSNRMVCFPYTKLMNSNDHVDMGAALVLCSVEAALRAGVARSKWIFLHAGSDAHDTAAVSHRADLHSSPAIRIAGARALELAGVEADDLAHVDLYSCFPSAVQVSATELGLSQERPLTVTGGLTFGGGPLNNYVMHGIARTAEILREDPGRFGLVSGNGGFLTKHAFGVYSTEPPPMAVRHANCQEEVDAMPRREATVDHDGEATVEAYTVTHDAEGPAVAHAAFLTEDGHRTWGNCEDRDLAAAMTREEFCGQSAQIDGRGNFTVR